MEERPPTPPSGWYPGPDGRQRYWDGNAWLHLPAPEEPSVTPDREDVKAAKGHSGFRRWVVVGATTLALVGGGAGLLVARDAHEAKQAAKIVVEEQKSRDEQAARQKVQADAVEATRLAEVAKKAKQAQAAKVAQAALDKAERAVRKDSVSDIEKSIKKMAKKNVRDDVIKGPIISVSCDPVAGGSVDDLGEKTTAFQCFVANKDNDDGTLSGYYYHATMNWGTGSYTYGFGES